MEEILSGEGSQQGAVGREGIHAKDEFDQRRDPGRVGSRQGRGEGGDSIQGRSPIIDR